MAMGDLLMTSELSISVEPSTVCLLLQVQHILSNGQNTCLF